MMASLKCSLFLVTFFASFYIYPLCFSFLCCIFFSLAHQVVFFFYSLCNIKAFKASSFCCNLFITCKAGFSSFLFFAFFHTPIKVFFSLFYIFAFFCINPPSCSFLSSNFVCIFSYNPPS